MELRSCVRFAAALLAVYALTSCAPPSHDAVMDAYKLATPVQSVIIIDPTRLRDPEDLKAITETYCANQPLNGCFVFVYADRSLAPQRGEYFKDHRGQPLFQLDVNRATGLDEALWNCAVYPRTSLNECGAS
jgi:hypothetical protein